MLEKLSLDKEGYQFFMDGCLVAWLQLHLLLL